MDAYDYSRVLASVQRRVARFGRPVSLQGVTNGPADPNNPLAGPAAPPAAVPGVPAVFVEPSGLRKLGAQTHLTTLFKDCVNIAIAAPVAAIPDMNEMKFLIDGDGKIWKIALIDELKPGAIAVLYFLGLKLP